MWAALATYAFIYVASACLSEVGQISVYDSLSIKGALIFTAFAFFFSLWVCLLLTCVSDAAVARFKTVEKEFIELLDGSWEERSKTATVMLLETSVNCPHVHPPAGGGQGP